MLQMTLHTVEDPVTNAEEETYLVTFEFDGMEIFNPTISQCGRFEVDGCNYYKLTTPQYETMIRCNQKYFDMIIHA